MNDTRQILFEIHTLIQKLASMPDDVTNLQAAVSKLPTRSEVNLAVINKLQRHTENCPAYKSFIGKAYSYLKNKGDSDHPPAKRSNAPSMITVIKWLGILIGMALSVILTKLTS